MMSPLAAALSTMFFTSGLSLVSATQHQEPTEAELLWHCDSPVATRLVGVRTAWSRRRSAPKLKTHVLTMQKADVTQTVFKHVDEQPARKPFSYIRAKLS